MLVRAIRDHFDGSYRRAGEEFEYSGTSPHVELVIDLDQLRERFHRVILSRGYLEPAAQSILDRHFEPYCANVAEFVKMLESYENPHGSQEDD